MKTDQSAPAVTNPNLSGNMLRCAFYVCPTCGNIIHALGGANILCCGAALSPLKAGPVDDSHSLSLECVEDEHFICVRHEMTKRHYISFLAFVTSDRVQMVKLYPEGNPETRLQLRGHGSLYLYCNRHGLMVQKL